MILHRRYRLMGWLILLILLACEFWLCIVPQGELWHFIWLYNLAGIVSLFCLRSNLAYVHLTKKSSLSTFFHSAVFLFQAIPFGLWLLNLLLKGGYLSHTHRPLIDVLSSSLSNVQNFGLRGFFYEMYLIPFIIMVFARRFWYIHYLIGLVYTALLLIKGYQKTKRNIPCDPPALLHVKESVNVHCFRRNWRWYYLSFTVIFGITMYFIAQNKIGARTYPLIAYCVFPAIFLFSTYYNIRFIMSVPENRKLSWMIGTRSLVFMTIVFLFFEVCALNLLKLLPFNSLDYPAFYDALFMIFCLNILIPPIGIAYFLHAHNPMPDKWSRIILITLGFSYVFIWVSYIFMGIMDLEHTLRLSLGTIRVIYIRLISIVPICILFLQQRYLDWLFLHDEKISALKNEP